MKAPKKKNLEAAGWRVGSAEEFLGLSAVEAALVDIKVALGKSLRERRAKLHLSQRGLATRIASSQSRLAKMEAADPDVSIDLLLRGLLATGVRRQELARVIAVHHDKPRR